MELRTLAESFADAGIAMAHCNQVVMLTCLHLQHEMALREVGAYAWTTPNPKDAAGSMMRIMKSGLTLRRLRNTSLTSRQTIAPRCRSWIR